ncbi:hypothetical protein EDD22DRAFT_903298 [Suillus occidentalis]|nr:hypothetical protein EDD22DRAFT_903298 [Suillus occidentalis]
MDSLPLDLSHPAVRDYLSLVRLQVLTPLSLLINIATLLVCSVIVKPSIGSIIELHPTSISPSPRIIAVYVVVILLGQVGYCTLLVIARKPETKELVLSLVFANWLMALWAVFWVLEFFLISTVLLGLITLGLYFSPSNPEHYARFAWPGFGVTFGANMIGLAVVLMRCDIVWAVAATWICASIWSARPKPAPVYITVIVFTVLHPLALLGTLLYRRLTKREGRIALPPDEEHDTRRGPREVDAHWGSS